MATKLAPVQMFDLGSKMVPWEQRRAEGKALRDAIPRESHAGWKPGKKRPDPMKLLATSNKGRQSDFVPLRMGRVAASPFVFLGGGMRDGGRSFNLATQRNSSGDGGRRPYQ